MKDKLDWEVSESENRQIGGCGTISPLFVSRNVPLTLTLPFLALEFPRPCIGSRIIVCRCWSKILPAVMRDMADWTTPTRLKA